MQMMRALRLETFGDNAKMTIREVPKPIPANDEVLVEVWSAGLNPSDASNVAGRFPQTTLPRTPGRDFAGIVVEGGGDLEGAEVWGTGGPLGFTLDGTHADYVLLPANAVRVKPKGLTCEQAGAIGVPYVTAWSALVRAADLRAGETVLIVGATGAVGSAAAQIAKWRGAHTIGATRRPIANRTFDGTINTAEEELAAGIKRLSGNAGVDLVLDTVGASMFEPALMSLGFRGRMVAISSRAEHRVAFDLVHFYHRELSLYGVDSLKLDLESSVSVLDSLAEGFDSGALTPPVVRSFPLDRAVEAYDLVSANTAKGKIVLAPQAAEA